MSLGHNSTRQSKHDRWGGSKEHSWGNADLDWVNECANHSRDAQERFVNCKYRIVDSRDRRLARVGVEDAEKRREGFACGGRGGHQARAIWKAMRGNEMGWRGGYLYISASVVPDVDTLVTLYQFGGSTQACMVYPNKPRMGLEVA